MLLRRAALLVAIVLALAGLTASPAMSPASASSTASTTMVGLNGTLRQVPTSLATRVRSGQVGGLTAAQLSQLGIRPGTRYKSEPLPTIKVVSKVTAHPDSASGCTGFWSQVCIYINGSHRYIHTWNTSWLGAGSGCTFGIWWWGNFEDYTTSPDVCGNGNFYGYWTPNLNFPTGKACNTWLGTSLEPCETIKS